MAHSPASASLTPRLFLQPWAWLVASLLLALLGLIFGQVSFLEGLPDAFRLVPLFAATLLAVAALSRHFRTAPWASFADRLEPAAMVSLSGLICLAGYLTMRPDWVSGQMFYAALFLLTLAGSLLIMLPQLSRRVLISLFVVFHFAGMVVCATSVDPPGAQGAWLSKQLWTWVYRPYLSFLYMTNAYHFYSPDPGPPSLLWFAVHFDDGTYRWVKLPDRDNSPIGMHYQRHLALPEHVYAPLPRLPLTEAERRQAIIQERLPARPVRGSWENILKRRCLGSTYYYVDSESNRYPIPVVLDAEVSLQYREPGDTSRRLLASVAKRVFWTTPPPREGVRVKSVKLYRVTNRILSPLELSQGVSPLEKTKHWAWFLGEFDSRGNLVDELDPFLYWYLPIVRVSERYPFHQACPPVVFGMLMTPRPFAINANEIAPKNNILLDCLELHAAGRRVDDPPEENK